MCLLGICMARAQGLCADPGSEQGCEPGYRCFNTDMMADAGVCFPPFDPVMCDGVESRAGVCSPVRGDVCDAQCGAACTPSGVGAENAGAACKSDGECSLKDALCYADVGSETDPHGWVEGYCLSFGCKTDAPCGPEAGCFFSVTNNGTGACMNTCGIDLDCRAGYVCTSTGEAPGSICSPGCDAAATCPGGYRCLGEICVSNDIACSATNPFGWCPGKAWCDKGTCNGQKFECDKDADALEPNDGQAAAASPGPGTTEGLTLCEGDEDWYRIVVPAKTLTRVGIRFQHAAGDVDLVAYEASGKLLGSRYSEVYPYSYRDQETNTEYYGFHSELGDTYYVRAVGYKGAENVYSLHVDSFPYVDGPSCAGAGFTFAECAGTGSDGNGLLPFPFPDPDDSAAFGNYFWETFSNYRFARRELIMLVRHALSETVKAFPGTTPLSLVDICQIDGITPGYDVGEPRHPESTHNQGGNIDIAYFQTDGSNNGQIICGDGSEHADGYCSSAAAQKHVVDLPRQAYFMAKLYSSARTRVIGVDTVLAPLLESAAQELAGLPNGNPKKITADELKGFTDKLSYGDGWPYHHHHIHLSLRWWSQDGQAQGSPAGSARAGNPAETSAPGLHTMRLPGVAPQQPGSWPSHAR